MTHIMNGQPTLCGARRGPGADPTCLRQSAAPGVQTHASVCLFSLCDFKYRRRLLFLLYLYVKVLISLSMFKVPDKTRRDKTRQDKTRQDEKRAQEDETKRNKWSDDNARRHTATTCQLVRRITS